jgi:hypothetical protein
MGLRLWEMTYAQASPQHYHVDMLKRFKPDGVQMYCGEVERYRINGKLSQDDTRKGLRCILRLWEMI